MPNSKDQYLLDFTSSEYDARRLLRSALKQANGAKLEHWDFLWWIRNIETEKAGLKKTAEEIAENLWCHPRSVHRYINFLLDHHLIRITEHHGYQGSQQANEYRIDWDGVRQQLGFAMRELGATRQPVAECQSVTPPCQSVSTPCQPVTPPRQIGTRTKETLSLLNLSEYSGPDPAREAGPGLIIRKPSRRRLLFASPHDWLRSAGLDGIPELVAGADLRIGPMPSSQLVYGVWAKLLAQHLEKTSSLVEWHRRQLSLESPVCGDTEADLLLVLAAGIEAIRVPNADVKKTRVAIFVNTVNREIWRPVLKHIRAARKGLDDLATQAGGPYWRSTLTQTEVQ